MANKLKNMRQVQEIFIKQVKSSKWQFIGKFRNRKNILLRYAGDRQIIRHKLIKGVANPYNLVWLPSKITTRYTV